VRDDLAATLAVRAVSIDQETRREIDQRGLQRFADLHSTLTAAEMGGSITAKPAIALSGARGTCVYECLLNESRDHLRVVLVDTGQKVYQVNILVTPKAADTMSELAQLQDAFVQEMSW